MYTERTIYNPTKVVPTKRLPDTQYNDIKTLAHNTPLFAHLLVWLLSSFMLSLGMCVNGTSALQIIARRNVANRTVSNRHQNLSAAYVADCHPNNLSVVFRRVRRAELDCPRVVCVSHIFRVPLFASRFIFLVAVAVFGVSRDFQRSPGFSVLVAFSCVVYRYQVCRLRCGCCINLCGRSSEIGAH